jgi:hypothetical protein
MTQSSNSFPLCCSCRVYYNINSIASGDGGWSAVLVMAAAAVSPKTLKILKSDGRTRRMMLADMIAALMLPVQQTL